MKNFLLTLAMCMVCVCSASAQNWYTPNSTSQSSQRQTQHYATMTFTNRTNHVMTLKVINNNGFLYRTTTLNAYGSQTVSFSSTATYKLLIKAVYNGQPSYHDGGYFSVTCSNSEYTEGVMEFSISNYGSGLGPSISSAEFEKYR